MSLNLVSANCVRLHRRRRQRVALFDIDGTASAMAAGRPVPPAPYPGVGKTMELLQAAGFELVAVTGASHRRVQVLERQMGLPQVFSDVYSSYGGRWVARGPNEVDTILCPTSELAALRSVTSLLNDVRDEYDAEQTDAGACYAMHLLRPYATDEDFYAACTRVKEIIAEKRVGKLLELRPTLVDFGIVVIPASMNKAIVTKHIAWSRRMKEEFDICAGDTLADLPLLRKARFPIVTRAEKGKAIPPALLEIVKRKGGYVAKEDEDHGLGVIAGVQAALKAGVFTL